MFCSSCGASCPPSKLYCRDCEKAITVGQQRTSWPVSVHLALALSVAGALLVGLYGFSQYKEAKARQEARAEAEQLREKEAANREKQRRKAEKVLSQMVASIEKIFSTMRNVEQSRQSYAGLNPTDFIVGKTGGLAIAGLEIENSNKQLEELGQEADKAIGQFEIVAKQNGFEQDPWVQQTLTGLRQIRSITPASLGASGVSIDPFVAGIARDAGIDPDALAQRMTRNPALSGQVQVLANRRRTVENLYRELKQKLPPALAFETIEKSRRDELIADSGMLRLIREEMRASR